MRCKAQQRRQKSVEHDLRELRARKALLDKMILSLKQYREAKQIPGTLVSGNDRPSIRVAL
jgi:hypothetical protein